MSITHSEVRRHPLWKEQAVPEQDQGVKRSPGTRLIFVTFGVIVAITVLSLLFL